jgi:hypothetical protein
MDFSEALTLLKNGTETKLRRKQWPTIYYCYIDNRFNNKFMFVYSRPFFIDEDLLANDWELYKG